MASSRRKKIPGKFAEVKTPAYIVDFGVLENNLRVLKKVKDRTGCKVLLALKCFSMYSSFPLIRQYLDGVCASSANEARLGSEEFGKEVHTFGAAYSEEGFRLIKKYSDHIIFNSISQWEKFRKRCKNKDIGLRINPDYSEIKTELYDPCAKNSRLGVKAEELKGKDLRGVSGLHFHALCQQNSDTLERILERVEEKFGRYMHGMRWMNFGGGHHITRGEGHYSGEKYDIGRLCRLVNDFKKRYGVQVILEPGEAVVLDAGFLVSSVLDIKGNIAILDASAEAHMPDVVAMPYTPPVAGAGKPGKFKHEYILAGPTCLAGDNIGEYSFKDPLQIGDRIVFEDMALYTMVKNTTFNGIGLPSINVYRDGSITNIKRFGYRDFKRRL